MEFMTIFTIYFSVLLLGIIFDLLVMKSVKRAVGGSFLNLFTKWLVYATVFGVAIFVVSLCFSF